MTRDFLPRSPALEILDFLLGGLLELATHLVPIQFALVLRRIKKVVYIHSRAT